MFSRIQPLYSNFKKITITHKINTTMKKYILTIMLFSLGFAGYAQVGIGTASPTTTLHVVESGSFSSTTGITIPVVTEDMTTTTIDGTEPSQLVYSTNASSTGYYYWNGTAWTALVPADAARTVTETSDSSYSIQLSDDIIVYGGGTASFTFPTGATIGKTFTIIAAGAGDITLDTLTDGSNTLPGGSGSTYIYLGEIDGSEEWAALHSY